jgi:sterol desaturase/sphingolipid hydroxylase (fatty acid hydroxylase superfamily)
MSKGIWRRLSDELAKPRSERPFGSGWLSGTLALLFGLVGLLLVGVMRYPNWFMTPELSSLHLSGYVSLFVHVVLLLGYGLSLLSLLLSRNKTLGSVALFVAILASLLGGSNAEAVGQLSTSLYFGLDFFVLNVLFLGVLFVPLERVFPHRKEQTLMRPEWQEDLFYYLVSSMLVQILTFMTMAPSNFVSTSLNLSAIQAFVGSIPFLVQLFVIMAITDFVQYWLHRTFHQVPWLWKFHAVHHSAQSMDWIAGARMHFIEIALLRGVTALPILSLGFNPVAVQVYVLIVYFYSSFIHANIGWNLKALEKIVVTPRFHHWHHGKGREAIDINFSRSSPESAVNWVCKIAF